MVSLQQRKIIISVSLILIIFSIFRTVYSLWDSYLPDFSVIYYSASILFTHGNPYMSKTLFTQVNYPPIALVLMMPFLLFEFYFAAKVWLILSVILLLTSIYILYKIWPVPLLFILTFTFLTVNSFPFKFTLGMGQVNILILFLLTSYLFLTRVKKETSALVMIVISIAIKLFPAVLLISYFLKFQWKKLLVVLIILALIFFSPVLFLGKEIYFYYFNNILFPLFLNPSGGVYYNQSITGLFARMEFPTTFLAVSRVFILFITFLVIIKRKLAQEVGISLLLVSILLINNFTWQHHLILLVLPFYFSFLYSSNKFQLLLLAISYILVAYNIKNPTYFSTTWYGSLYLSHGFFGQLFLWLLLMLKKSEQKNNT